MREVPKVAEAEGETFIFLSPSLASLDSPLVRGGQDPKQLIASVQPGVVLS